MRLAAAAALLLAAAPLLADDAALAKCRAITGEAERLRCFDSLATPAPAPAAPAGFSSPPVAGVAGVGSAGVCA